MESKETFTLKEAIRGLIDYCQVGDEYEALEELFMNEGHAQAVCVFADAVERVLDKIPDMNLEALVIFEDDDGEPKFKETQVIVNGSTEYPDIELVEHGNGYCLYWGSKTAWLGDGVDHMSDFEIGTEEFRTEWESEIKENWSEVKEAYFGEDN